MNKKELTWDEVRKNLNLTPEEEEEIKLEEEIIQATIEARKKNNLTQQELSNLTGVKQPAIARIENYTNSPMVTTLIKLLVPMGYTLRVVPLEKVKKEEKQNNNDTEKILKIAINDDTMLSSFLNEKR